MATAGSKQAVAAAAAAADQAEFDPKWEWQENDTSFSYRIHTSGFSKQDCRVQVDGAGRLTVIGQRSHAAANPRNSRFSKVFQLSSTTNNDGITGRFDAGVLTVTVLKQHAKAPPAGDAKPPPPPQDQDQRKAKEDEQANKPKDDAKPEDAAAASKKPAPAADAQQVADAKSGKPEPAEQPKAAAPPPPPDVRKEKGKPKAGCAPAPAAADTKQATPKPAPPPPQADAEWKAVDPESQAETETETETDAAERQRKGACRARSFKERVAEELQGLAGSEWAEGLVVTVKKNREVIAAAVAAFSLGVFVSSELFSRSWKAGTETNNRLIANQTMHASSHLFAL
ncbi:uncharacterized protein [Miscanthus floridulus]|uniref:uncharacterized protein n=1 Tax=Miscanthus floridulus TaxID=154761 RepID=UPI003458F732